MNDSLFLAALHSLPGITHVRLRSLTNVQSSWQHIWEYLPKYFSLLQLPQEKIEKLLVAKNSFSIDELQKKIEKYSIQVVCEGSSEYPKLLSHISAAPFVLYVRGDPELLKESSIAVVGTRKVSHYGRELLDKTIPLLVERNIPVISGLALGTDLEAQRLVVAKEGRTVGVLGSGVDIIYPVPSQKLVEALLSVGGCLVSDFPIGTAPEPYHFPMRNRIIAGLAKSILVVEAGEKSGSVITAHLGLEQGKDIYAYPGSVFSSVSLGTNQLIAKSEAQLVVSPNELLVFLGYGEIQGGLTQQKTIPDEVQNLYALISQYPVEEQELLLNYGLKLPLFQMHMTLLELEGVIQKVEGTKWKRKN